MSQDNRPNRPLQIRLIEWEIQCTDCGELHTVDEETPRNVYDPEQNRFVCPTCLEVITVMPYLEPVPETGGTEN